MITEFERRKALVTSILGLFGTYRRAAEILGTPEPTVYAWVQKGNIPYWRRDAVLKAARRRRAKLNDAMLAYLQSTEKTPKVPCNETSITQTLKNMEISACTMN
jgi:hypothetical protein